MTVDYGPCNLKNTQTNHVYKVPIGFDDPADRRKPSRKTPEPRVTRARIEEGVES